jgi:hypothetical protein
VVEGHERRDGGPISNLNSKKENNMEYEPYKELVRSVVCQELTQSGWIELLRIPIENPEKATSKDIQDTLEAVHKMFYKADKLELSVQGVQLCIRNIDISGRTFRVCASPHCPDGPEMIA